MRNAMKHKTLFWIVLFAVIAVTAGGYYAVRGENAVKALVYVDGELYGSYDLASVVIPYEETIRSEYGYNTLRISRGAIEVLEADCEGQDCVRQGAIRDSLLPIVCLPHHVVIEIEE